MMHTRCLRLILLFIFFPLMLYPKLGACESQDENLPLDDLRTFADVFDQIRLGYVEEVKDSTLLRYAIQGMLIGLDPHSIYMDQESFADLQSSTSGEFSGLGLEIGIEDGYIKVISPIDGSPAAAAGLQTGDIILKLDSTSLKGVSLNEAVSKMRGPKGTKILLTIGRTGESRPLEIIVVRDVISIASVRHRILEDGFGYIRIAQFQNKTGESVEKALLSLKDKSNLRGIVLDLRNNPGGILKSSIAVADLFLSGGKVVYTVGRLTDSSNEYFANSTDLSEGIPLIVLINGGSASASEIVAGALQDHSRAVIMGTRSFGKGSVQSILHISEERAIKLTTALYFTPKGRSIQAEGIKPDITVDRAKVTTLTETGRISEKNLARHLGEKSSKTEKSEDPSDVLINTDNQLYEALTLLKGLDILSRNSSLVNNGKITISKELND